MTERVRFHLDENVDPIIAIALRRYGIDVTTTMEAGLRTSDDQDDDFLRLVAGDQDQPGIAYCHLEARSIGEMIQGLRLIYEVLSPEEMRMHIEYL